MGKLRFAWRTCKNLKVEKLFPNLQNEYRSSTLQKLFRKGQFDLAAAFVGRDEKLQRTFMEMLEAEGLKEAAFEIHSAYEMVCDLPFNGTNDNDIWKPSFKYTFLDDHKLPPPYVLDPIVV